MLTEKMNIFKKTGAEVAAVPSENIQRTVKIGTIVNWKRIKLLVY